MSKRTWERSVLRRLPAGEGSDLIKPLLRLYTTAEAREIDLICCYLMQSYLDYRRECKRFRVLALVHRGWGPETSILMFKNFRLAFPQLRYDPAVHVVMSRAQLVEEYGMFGHMLDTVAHRPGTQVFLEQLLLGACDVSVPRPVYRVVMEFEVPVEGVVGVHMDLEEPVSLGEVVPYHEASRICKDVIGEDLDCMADIRPLWTDYEELAKAGTDLRTPHGKE